MGKTLSQSTMSNNEISGKPGALWGPLPIPMRGRTSAKVVGDILQATVTNGAAKQIIKVRVQNIDNVEFQEAPNYFLLVLGYFLALLGGLGILSALLRMVNYFGLISFISSVIGSLIFLVPGILIILYARKNKSKLMTFRTPCCVIPIFFTADIGMYEQFGNNVLLLARQLNSPVSPQAQKRPQPAQTQGTRAV
ncbi:hypothetical protein VB780_31055 [Leptolyngbya sp. CCNP1308]|uniref:hypothetical protein n=1 Tax=Leptolyngbya sp. CCNP1308 TaxID=3110255 RepID=UPI002B20F0B3|nr:hypothetical protein [Leptolyngbya sp. CCNP1308]MEA5453051.1 hypothetical protein [Leptolyngbya sp. CCNP1308]